MSRKKRPQRRPLSLEVVYRNDGQVSVIMDNGVDLLGHPPIPEESWREILRRPSASWFRVIDPLNNPS